MKKGMPIVGYDLLTREYYEEDLHPTSDNFRAGSKQLYDLYFQLVPFKKQDLVVEAGAGKSLAAEWLSEQGYPLDYLRITDLHAAMLSYSSGYQQFGAKLAECAADRLYDLVDDQDWLVSSLGDPYNTNSFWNSTYKVLRLGGHVIFTTPSFEWAEKFRAERQDNDNVHAHFLMRDGRLVGVPSMIYDRREQANMGVAAGLTMVRCDDIYVAQLGGKVSPKLFFEDSSNIPILTGYLFRKD